MTQSPATSDRPSRTGTPRFTGKFDRRVATPRRLHGTAPARPAVALLVLSSLAASASGAPPALPSIEDDPVLAASVTLARERFLARQPFKRFDVTVLLRSDDGRWRRGSVGGAALAYPASAVKLAYLVAAVHWCDERGHAPGCLDADVRPMIVDSDNVATGRVVDAISGAPNVESDSSEGFDAWLEKRRYTERLLASVGLLGGQRLLEQDLADELG